MTRKGFLKSLATIPFGAMAMDLYSFSNEIAKEKSTGVMPTLFIGHGNPMHALYDNGFTKSLAAIRSNFEKPKAILVVSAHWLTRGTFVAGTPKPKTIHDFGGFPEALFQVEYPAPGAPDLAKEVAAKLPNAKLDHEWGLDHGAWTVLKHMYPDADIPVFQLSLDYAKPENFHLELASYLQFLRGKGVLILASGNIVHNLRTLNWQKPDSAFDWALEFDTKVKMLLEKGDYKELSNYKAWGRFAELSVPTNDHYLPLMYTLGCAHPKEEVTFLYEGIEMGSVSMRCFMVS